MSGVCIGIDQSYEDTGISVCVDGSIKVMGHVYLGKLKSKTEKRNYLKLKLEKVIKKALNYGSVTCIIERIRLRSEGFLNIDYIKSIGALNAVIVDICAAYGVSVYSVDTRCWKAQIIGTSKGSSNKCGVPENKWPTIKYFLQNGKERCIIEEVSGRKTKGTFERNGKKYRYNDNIADSGAISLFWFKGDKNKLKVEK